MIPATDPHASLAESVGPLDEGSSLPLYQQLQRAPRKAIEIQLLGPQDALPAERDLASDFNVSRITVRKALDRLVAEGLLVRETGVRSSSPSLFIEATSMTSSPS